MSSPVMIPFKSIIVLERKSHQTLILQLANQLIKLINNGTLKPEALLPGSRKLADMLLVHRKTVVAAYEELVIQGWLISKAQQGTYVNANLPIVKHNTLANNKLKGGVTKAGFTINTNPIVKFRTNKEANGFISLNDGVSDVRLTPLNTLAKLYRNVAAKESIIPYLSYTSTYGHPELRATLVNYLNKTRGLNISIDNILLTRGSQMGINLACNMLFNQGDFICVGATNYTAADICAIQNGAKIIRIEVDEKGLNTVALEAVCKSQSIKAVYVTPHHHHPTTVTLSAARRLHLLQLAKEYNFAIMEDDYDYDFHYNNAPILPLASYDLNGNVIYIGSVCKTVAPVFRIGYMVAAKEVIDEAANLRRYIDRQGDALLELSFSRFIKNGDLDRHINKALKIYKTRRDMFCMLLKKELSNFLSFQIPTGGMAVWVILDLKYSWARVEEVAKEYCLNIGAWERYDVIKAGHNGIRMGFATYNESEMITLVQRLKKVLLIVSSENNNPKFRK